MVWSDPKIQELAKRFVPCADEVFRLQNGGDAECELFQEFCDQGHYREPKATRQGIYAVTPGGILLGSLNTQRPREVEEMLEAALLKWREIPREERRLNESQRSSLASVWRWESLRPEDGLILEVTSRDILAQEDQPAEERRRRGRRRFNWSKQAWNRDYAWFTAEEIRSWIPEQPALGASKAMPSRHVERLARFHLMDNVRGQTSDYKRSEIEHAEMRWRVESVTADELVLSLSGSTRAEVERGDYPHGFAAELEGVASWDLKARRFSAFELRAQAESWGHTRFNNRRRGPESRAIGVVMRLAPTDAPKVAPAFIWNYGWSRGR
ncbi:MAG: hypothetical protein ACYTG5_07880 [Planctomycetota bacterium]